MRVHFIIGRGHILQKDQSSNKPWRKCGKDGTHFCRFNAAWFPRNEKTLKKKERATRDVTQK